MRTIQKNREPNSLTKHRQQPHASYNNYMDKNALRQSLVTEQRGLCCYCQSRIRPNATSMKIEHWQCQAAYPARQLDYRNLLGACLGGHGRPEREQHCDTRKGNRNLCFYPADPAQPVERHFKFLGNGEITSDDAAIDTEIKNILNLNLGQLVSNRKAVLDAFKQRLGKGNLNAAQELQNWDGTQPGNLPEYAQVIVFWLEKKIARTTP
ncbi:MAG: TIGR02646 family protein [Gammaproteobacteria bacterium]|nr:MAG: TIGR02646 family protein [Gammaproteobacteria bacterium]